MSNAAQRPEALHEHPLRRTASADGAVTNRDHQWLHHARLALTRTNVWNNGARHGDYPPSYWDRVSALYDDLYMNEWSQCEDAQTRSLLHGAIPQKETLRVLDLGSGTGLGYQLLSELGVAFSYSGLDISQDMCVRLRWKYPSAVVRCGNFDNRKHWPPGQFDFIMLLYGTFSFGQSPESTLRYIRKRLSDDGRAVISVCNRHSLRRLLRMQFASIEHYATRGAGSALGAVRMHTYSMAQFSALCRECGLDVVSVCGQGVLAGVAEWPCLWKTELLLQKRVPALTHLMSFVVKRGIR